MSDTTPIRITALSMSRANLIRSTEQKIRETEAALPRSWAMLRVAEKLNP
jgi:hypothetical protein